MRIVAAPDKFKGTASAQDIAAAIRTAGEGAGHTVDVVPMADGGEGTLAALGGPNRTSTVTGPLGELTSAEWRIDAGTAAFEMAQASGLVLAGGKEHNDPMAATTTGVGEILVAALDAGANRIIVGLGGSATTDGGLGAVEAVGEAAGRLAEIELLVACDVRTQFTDAAAVFGPQKGASPVQVEELTDRLVALVGAYNDRFGVDVSTLERAGAAGGLAGGLAALGARLVDGFGLVAEIAGLDAALDGADLVVTGEGLLDEESFNGKVVGGVTELAKAKGIPVLAIAGHVLDEALAAAGDDFEAISLTTQFGQDEAMSNPTTCIHEAVTAYLAPR